MALNAVASQSGRSASRNNGTTPSRNVSPGGRGTRSGSTAPQTTPATRRSARTASRNVAQSKDAVNNPALPEIQTRQSYAYGSSKAPQLPEQLYARGTMSMQQVADQMNSDIHKAQVNLDVATEGQVRPTSKTTTQIQQNDIRLVDSQQTQTRRRQTTPVSQTTEVQKQKRTAAWASSLDESQLDDIAEESSPPGSPETRRTDPSSFPSGIFDHSYAYERGMRAPRIQQQENSATQLLHATWQRIRQSLINVANLANRGGTSLFRSISQVSKTTTRTILEVPLADVFTVLLKILVGLSIVPLLLLSSCYVYRNALCDGAATSQLSYTLQKFCGACQHSYGNSWNLTADGHNNIHKITASLNSISSRINSIESRLSDRIDSKHAHLQTEMNLLRKEQHDLTSLLQNLGQGGDSDIASPLIPQVNFFDPSNGAIVNPWFTSPTRSRVQSLPVRVALGLIGLKKYQVNQPVTALMTWHDVGDCWCASASTSDQDSVRIGVEVKEMIYPTELVVEHTPVGTTLSPDTAPREIELWADVSHLTVEQWQSLDIENMRVDGAGVKDPLSSKNTRRFAKYAAVEYDASSPRTNHIQRFKLDINQSRDLKYAASMFVVRVRTNHGAEYSCIYRIRLHGTPVVEDTRRSKFTEAWVDDDVPSNDR